MIVTRTITKDVERCTDCPYYLTDIDGGVCKLLEEENGVYNGFVLPEGLIGIHPDCPIAKKGK